jgi:peptide deformylase
MSVVPILKVPDEKLYLQCEKVTDFGEETRKIIEDMKDTLDSAREPEGAGLAAPQIGALKRVVVVRNFYKDPADGSKTVFEEFVLVNPKIVSTSKELVTDWEGCLSVPDVYGKVERFKKIKIKALNEEGEEIRLTATGFFATVIQHEMDHLDGIIFTSKVIGETLNEKELDRLYNNEGAPVA